MCSIPELCRKIMDPKERLAYLSGHEVIVESKVMPDIGKSKGGLMPVSVLYRPLCRGVRVGDWHPSAGIAISEGISFLRRWDGQVRLWAEAREEGPTG